jgi:putative oxidoreductase
MDWLLLVARILFVWLFVTSGLMFHLRGRKMAIEYARSERAPSPELTVPGTGVVMVIAGVMVVLGVWVDLAALALGACALVFAIFMHAFWRVEDPMQRANQQAHFNKNLGLVAGSLILFYLFQQFGDAIDLTVGPEALF